MGRHCQVADDTVISSVYLGIYCPMPDALQLPHSLSPRTLPLPHLARALLLKRG